MGNDSHTIKIYYDTTLYAIDSCTLSINCFNYLYNSQQSILIKFGSVMLKGSSIMLKGINLINKILILDVVMFKLKEGIYETLITKRNII